MEDTYLVGEKFPVGHWRALAELAGVVPGGTNRPNALPAGKWVISRFYVNYGGCAREESST
jgi:hypothetical protein